ncbi:TPA: hypothetical protein ACKJ83_000750 [Neisseria gonorrhoeae]
MPSERVSDGIFFSGKFFFSGKLKKSIMTRLKITLEHRDER